MNKATLVSLQTTIEQIQARNKRVERDKAWETSNVRKVSIMLLTYLIIGLVLTVMGNDHPWLNAIIPVLGFLLSTLTLQFIRLAWEKYCYRR